MTVWRKLLAAATVLATGLLAIPGAHAGPILADTWSEFSFTDIGQLARGCDPADPLGAFCIQSFGTPTVPLDAPPWTFTSATGVLLTITDAFESGDRFEVFDFGVSIGLTSMPAASALVDCGSDPVECVATGGMSVGTFILGAGSHSITLVPVLAPSGGGAGYLFVGGAAVAEPDALWLLATGLLVLMLVRRRTLARRDRHAT